MIQILIFLIISVYVFYKATGKFYEIYQNINLGKPQPTGGSSSERLRNMVLFALGQKKMFSRPVSGIFHLFIYVAFLFTQLELIEILLDGLFGIHRMFASFLGGFYTFLINFIELISVLAFVATFVFLFRRNIIKVLRFRKPELIGWPSLDANLILFGEILLITGIFTMNSTDQLLQQINPSHYPSTGTLFLSGILSENVFQAQSEGLLVILERAGWWLHLLVIYGFILYLPYSKHLHIFLAFPNSYFSNLESRGKISNIPVIENEARGMLGLKQNDQIEASESFGAKDIFDLDRRTLLASYSCTECGRCTSVCPANITGKKLSPRKIVMDIRDRLEEVGRNIKLNKMEKATSYDDGKSLFDYISKEEIYACTTCNACVEACPILINPMDPILQLRRYDILMNSGGPSDWLPMFNSLENNQSVWQLPESRDAWTTKA